jgi:hypothetical protein
MLGLGLVVMLTPGLASACATCYGASDAPMAQGMNWGIFTLLGVIGSVLAGITSFFVFLGWRSSKLSCAAESAVNTEH